MHYLSLITITLVATLAGTWAWPVATTTTPRTVVYHARYSSQYSVADRTTGDQKSVSETRNGDVTTGHYSLLQPDGVVRTVNYTVTPLGGFQAQVTNNGTAVHPVQHRHRHHEHVAAVIPAVVVRVVPAKTVVVEVPADLSADHVFDLSRLGGWTGHNVGADRSSGWTDPNAGHDGADKLGHWTGHNFGEGKLSGWTAPNAGHDGADKLGHWTGHNFGAGRWSGWTDPNAGHGGADKLGHWTGHNGRAGKLSVSWTGPNGANKLGDWPGHNDGAGRWSGWTGPNALRGGANKLGEWTGHNGGVGKLGGWTELNHGAASIISSHPGHDEHGHGSHPLDLGHKNRHQQIDIGYGIGLVG